MDFVTLSGTTLTLPSRVEAQDAEVGEPVQPIGMKLTG